MTARSLGSRSPCATTTALIAGKRKAAPERREEASRVRLPTLTLLRSGTRVCGHAQPHEEIDELQDHERHDRRIADRRGNRDRLDPELSRVAGDEAVPRRAVHRERRE